MNREPTYFLLIDPKKNVLPVRAEDTAELIRRVGVSNIRTHQTAKEFNETLREYFKTGRTHARFPDEMPEHLESFDDSSIY